jgi:dolichol-phosphate mannosyltransferase
LELRHIVLNLLPGMADGKQVSVIIPTINEAENLRLLIPRVAAALAGRDFELIVVDDGSRDGTPEVVAELARTFPLTLQVRDNPRDGLSGAVLTGFRLARGDVLAVMDADLQHPPERLPALLDPLERDEADFVIGSRHAPGGTVAERWGLFRRLNSRVATLLARPFAGPATTDPMSGFFALRRTTLAGAQRLTPLGYKIGLELMCKCRVRRVREVPIHFSARQHGRSKLTIKQQFRYLEHLSRLYDFTFPRLSPVVKFLIATACGWFVGFALYLIFSRAGTAPPRAATLSYPAAILTTAAFHLRYVRTQQEFLITKTPWRDFWLISLGEWAACALAATWVAHRAREIHALEVFALTYGAATLARYVLRKELMQDIRGLRRELRKEEVS